ESQRRAVLMNRRDAAGRLATFLALMAEHQEPAAGRAIHVPMTRSDIADFLGLSLESVSRATAELKARRLARFETRHRVRILDEAGLARLIGDV
ncbi:MAG: helix-turn-helix domain-containing protein, partial [Acidobacteria bacterium]|nr:helix-turn-helix domain-containing protein [Acidobacteriota bacterium]